MGEWVGKPLRTSSKFFFWGERETFGGTQFPGAPVLKPPPPKNICNTLFFCIMVSYHKSGVRGLFCFEKNWGFFEIGDGRKDKM